MVIGLARAGIMPDKIEMILAATILTTIFVWENWHETEALPLK
jgi:hypothetical protein